MSSISDLCPSLPIRISRAQLLLLLADLKPVVDVSLFEEYRTGGPHLVPLQFWPSWIEFFHEPLMAFWQRLNVHAETERSRYRTQLNAFEAAMCGLALRAAARKERTGPPSGNSGQASRRADLMRTIENHRRRANRSFKNAVGATRSAELAIELHRYEMLLRPEWIPRLRNPGGTMLRLRKHWINQFVASATERLHEAGPPIPPDKEIRRLVRLFLAYTR